MQFHTGLKKIFLPVIPLIYLIACFSACNHQIYLHPTIRIETNFGDIDIEVYPDKAPKTANAFLSFVDSGYFRNSSFYRTLNTENQSSAAFKTELIQGGIWESNNKKAISLKGIEHETTQQTGILHKNGTISLARSSPGTANTEFFICIGDQPSYDYGGKANNDKQGFAAFGKVIKGMDVVIAIHNQPDFNQSLRPPVIISNIKRLN